MPVTASTATFDGPVQVDGSRQVREVHACPTGDVVFLFSAPADTNIAAIAAARAPFVAGQLVEREAESNLGRDGAFSFGEMTVAQFAALLRVRYRASEREETCRIAWWLLRRIAAGHITDAQCRTAFGLTTTQWTTFKTNTLAPQNNAWAAVLNATGA